MRKRLTACVILLLLYAAGAGAQETAKPKEEKASKLTDASLLTLVRFINGEFVRVQPKQSLPCDPKKVFHLKVTTAGQPEIDENKTVNRNEGSIRIVQKGGGCQTGSGVALRIIGQSLDSGLTFDVDKGTIRIDLNGGTGRKKGSWKEHIQVGVGGAGGGRNVPMGQKTGTTTAPDPAIQPLGWIDTPATIVLEFVDESGHAVPIPEITPDELKKYLSPLIAFTAKRSAAVQYIDSIPPEFKKGIQEHDPMIGMDEEMLYAAMAGTPHAGAGGKPGDCGENAPPTCKVTEKNADGADETMLIYGAPPNGILVYLVNGKVIRVNKPGFAQNAN